MAPLTVDSIIGLADFVPPALFAAAGRVAGQINQRAFDTVTTNVPGPQAPLYLLGRQFAAAHPVRALAPGVRLSTAIASYNGRINFGSAPTTTPYATCRSSWRASEQTLDGLEGGVGLRSNAGPDDPAD